MRFAGIGVVVASVALLVFAATGLMRVSEMAHNLLLLSTANERPLDIENWMTHWRVSSGMLLLLSVAGVVAGTGLIRRRRWGLALWCSLVSLVLCGELLIKLLGVATYAFEETGWPEILLTTVVCAGSWFALSRTSRTGHET